jgi:predicted small integral membrane protein
MYGYKLEASVRQFAILPRKQDVFQPFFAVAAPLLWIALYSNLYSNLANGGIYFWVGIHALRQCRKISTNTYHETHISAIVIPVLTY